MLRTLKVTTCLATLTAIAGCTAVLGISSDPHTETAVASDGGGVTGDGGTCVGTLYVRIASDFSGTATDIAIPHFWGLYDYMRDLNQNGGVNGCMVDLDVQDNHYTGPVTVDVVNKWRTTDANWSKVNTVFIFGTGPTTSAGPDIMKEKKVIIPGSYAGAFDTPAAISKTITYDQVSAPTDTKPFDETSTTEAKSSAGWSYVFYPATDYGTGIRLALQAMQKINPGRVAFAHDTATACAFCVDPLAAGKSFVPNLTGMKLGRDLMIPQTSTDDATVTANVTAFIQAEIAEFKAQNTNTTFGYEPVQWIWSGNSVFASAIVGKAVAAQQRIIDADGTIKQILNGNNRTWKIRVMANNWGIGETTPTICGTDCNNDIMYGLFPVPRYGDLATASAMAQLTATRDAWAQKDQTTPPPAPITKRAYNDYRDVRYVQGYAAGAMWEAAVKAALATGVTTPTGDDIKNALEKFNKQDLGGLTAGPITFTSTDHRPQSNEVIYKVDTGGNLAFVDRYSITLTEEWLGY